MSKLLPQLMGLDKIVYYRATTTKGGEGLHPNLNQELYYLMNQKTYKGGLHVKTIVLYIYNQFCCITMYGTVKILSYINVFRAYIRLELTIFLMKKSVNVMC